MKVRHERLSVVTGDVTDPRSVAEAAADCDVVVSAVGGAADGRPEVVADAARALLDGLGTTRLFVVGGAGSLEHPDGGTVSSQPDFPDAWKPAARAGPCARDLPHRGRRRRLDLPQPGPRHRAGRPDGTYRTGDDALVVDDRGESRITIPDYAVAVVDELESPRFRGRRFTIGYSSTAPGAR